MDIFGEDARVSATRIKTLVNQGKVCVSPAPAHREKDVPPDVTEKIQGESVVKKVEIS